MSFWFLFAFNLFFQSIGWAIIPNAWETFYYSLLNKNILYWIWNVLCSLSHIKSTVFCWAGYEHQSFSKHYLHSQKMQAFQLGTMHLEFMSCITRMLKFLVELFSQQNSCSVRKRWCMFYSFHWDGCIKILRPPPNCNITNRKHNFCGVNHWWIL